MEQDNLFDNNLGIVDSIKLEKQVQDIEAKHQNALKPKKTLNDMMKQGRFDNIKQ